ncbi:MAG: isoprenyl transferase [Bosea sp. (in: a-proteobacteria)]
MSLSSESVRQPLPKAAEGQPPLHVAIIMDGNGRWAQARGLPRNEGHRRGVEALRRTVRAATDLGISYLTVFSFSTENWRRPAMEVSFLIALFKRFVRNDLAELHSSNVRVRMIGDRASTPPDIVELITQAEELTKSNTALTLVIAFNYGSRDEVVRATNRLIAARLASGDASPLTSAELSTHLDTADLPDPDLVIRTSGEVRLSNFLMWQSAYSELVFTPVLWPDFDHAALDAAVNEFRMRDRRFGGLAQKAV